MISVSYRGHSSHTLHENGHLVISDCIIAEFFTVLEPLVVDYDPMLLFFVSFQRIP